MEAEIEFKNKIDEKIIIVKIRKNEKLFYFSPRFDSSSIVVGQIFFWFGFLRRRLTERLICFALVPKNLVLVQY